MSRWWRAYDEAVDDPKLILLSDKAHRAWFNLMCIASLHDGALPDLKIVAVKLRTTPQRAAAAIAELVMAGLFDRREDGLFEPHNWQGRQYKSDVTDPTNATRQKRHRDKVRNSVTAVTETVTVTPPRDRVQKTDTETDSSEPNGSGDTTIADPRSRLFRDGLAKLASLTGKGPDACRSFVGKCLKAAEDNAVIVLGLIEEAERNQVVDAPAWILARLKPAEKPNGRRTVHEAARDLSRHLAALDEPAPSLCEPAGGSPLRLLPPGRRQ